jgi:uracil-DNA glycosylase
MKQQLDIEEIKNKIYQKLEPSGWAIKLRSFIYSSDFDNIIKELAKLSNEGKRFTPKLSQMFKAFEECNLKDLKIIILGQDPYHQIDVADGLSFSCGNTKKAETTLEFIFDEINRHVYKGHPGSLNPDLTRWSNQGVLMLNTALSTTVGKAGQHYYIWKPFMAYLFDYLNCNMSGLIYIYLGKEAQKWADTIDENNYKFNLSHPASAAYTNNKSWDSQNVFNEVNKIVENNYGTKIIW